MSRLTSSDILSNKFYETLVSPPLCCWTPSDLRRYSSIENVTLTFFSPLSSKVCVLVCLRLYPILLFFRTVKVRCFTHRSFISFPCPDERPPCHYTPPFLLYLGTPIYSLGLTFSRVYGPKGSPLHLSG